MIVIHVLGKDVLLGEDVEKLIRDLVLEFELPKCESQEHKKSDNNPDLFNYLEYFISYLNRRYSTIEEEKQVVQESVVDMYVFFIQVFECEDLEKMMYEALKKVASYSNRDFALSRLKEMEYLYSQNREQLVKQIGALDTKNYFPQETRICRTKGSIKDFRLETSEDRIVDIIIGRLLSGMLYSRYYNLFAIYMLWRLLKDFNGKAINPENCKIVQI